ncbi:MAG: carboxymuconolactone decarboxylase family protein [Burkholderiales bacterium]|jgi:AhpD family alkylhydroperoxidase|nr:carboxymuconolactone decarboxylase family protein [Burkholderiales bacterium]
MTPAATPRLPYTEIAPDLYQQLYALSLAVKQSGLAPRLLHLVDLRVSQINGCAYCVDMHGRELLAAGDSLQRLNSLVTWREVELFDARERAALHWAEQVTRQAIAHPAQDDFDALRPHFTDAEIVSLTFAIGVINTWNRLAVGFAVPVARRELRVKAA